METKTYPVVDSVEKLNEALVRVREAQKAYFIAIPTSAGTGSEVPPCRLRTPAEHGHHRYRFPGPPGRYGRAPYRKGRKA